MHREFGLREGGRVIRMGAVLCLTLVGLAAVSSLIVYLLPFDRSTGHGRIKAVPQIEASYLRWMRAHEEQGGDRNVVIALGWSKAYSRQTTAANGLVRLNLIDGKVGAELRNDPDGEIAELWAVDNLEGSGRTAAPESGDRYLLLGRFESTSPSSSLAGYALTSTLRADLGQALADFEVDLLVATPAEARPNEGGLLFGAPVLFQRLYTQARMERPRRSGSPFQVLARGNPRRFDKRVPTSSSAVPSFDPLIRMGAELFFNETFEGNGRTCGTCHPAENNFTIDPEFIAALPDDDPLFVAEFVPALAENFEKPQLMRQMGLILENTNGFGDLANNFTMRGVPHTLALGLALAPSGLDQLPVPPVQRTGWSGDGAPNDGSLRQFAQGAIAQHFPKTLDRVAGVDFRLATDDELDALEAFQLSLGRQEEIDLNARIPRSPVAALGAVLFQGIGRCNTCHENAGANILGANANFETGVEAQPDQPHRVIDPSTPVDDGFGSPGSGTFNIPVLVEAADTGPFFHNNSVETIEGAVSFYNSLAFNESLGARTSGPITLAATQVTAIAAFLRVLNADENGREAMETAEFVLDVDDFYEASSLLKLVMAEVDDAIEVLDGGGLHPEAQQAFRQAKAHLVAAAVRPDDAKRNEAIVEALTAIAEARADLLE